jgi:hypothetical protein
MLAATLLAIFIVPVLYVVVNNLRSHKPIESSDDSASTEKQPVMAGGER